jgi:hypothetical protein
MAERARLQITDTGTGPPHTGEAAGAWDEDVPLALKDALPYPVRQASLTS